ncbi:methionyl-tRNA formyltransferase [Candidatus Uhrbacteria bacterium]|nr:methionyl-tRNA formyltransferase [Candidatus Uhrbacteria bacterium]
MASLPTCVLLGTPAFAIPTADMLVRTPCVTFLGVITKPDEPVGRTQEHTPPPLKRWAATRGCSVWQPETKAVLTSLLQELHPDCMIVVAYGKIILSEALAVPRWGAINLHPSLLPKYRGPSPVHAAIAHGDQETGVTVMLLDAEIDHGPLLAQERVPIPDGVSRTVLEELLAERGAALLERILPEYFSGHIVPHEQNHADATFTSLLVRADGKLDWSQPAHVLARLVRAYEGWPGTWCLLPDGRRLKVLGAHTGDSEKGSPGMLAASADDRIAVICGDQQTLVLTEVQPEGRGAMTGPEFRRGQPKLMQLM